MDHFFFYLASAVMLAFGVLVVLNRNPVASALSLVVSFVGLAGLFILLEAHFLGIIQVLVYAGAVMVLFLFIIMLLDVKAEARRRLKVPALAGGMGIAAVMTGVLLHVVGRLPGGREAMPEAAGLEAAGYSEVRALGLLIFERYSFHLQVMGLLLLTATVGVIVLSRKEAR